jgi:hypothetical protein
VKEILDANYLNSDQKLKALKQYGYTTDKVNKVEKIKEKISACYWIL